MVFVIQCLEFFFVPEFLQPLELNAELARSKRMDDLCGFPFTVIQLGFCRQGSPRKNENPMHGRPGCNEVIIDCLPWSYGGVLSYMKANLGF